MQENSLEQRVRLGRLFDAYGCLLTEKQQKCLELYFCDDLSLAEIADELEVSRQAIHDLIKRVEHTLERYESKLALLARDDHDKKLLEEIKQHENLTDADMKKIHSEAEERMNKFVGQDYRKNIKEDEPDFYTMKSK